MSGNICAMLIWAFLLNAPFVLGYIDSRRAAPDVSPANDGVRRSSPKLRSERPAGRWS